MSIFYTDGSYMKKFNPNVVGWAVIQYVEPEMMTLTPDLYDGCTYDLDPPIIKVYNGVSDEPELVAMWNVGGELIAAMNAIDYAIKYAIATDDTDIHLYHDYAGVGKWITREWQAKVPAVQKYVQFVSDALKAGRENHKVDCTISFHQVKGHNNVPLNEIADIYAREAILNFKKS